MLHELNFDHCEHSKDPLVSCALEGVANIIAGISDVAIVIHSPQGCSATVASAFDTHEIDFTKRKVACSRLFESDIIMGATDKLKDLIAEADASFNTKVIFVVGTCAADIIGEDLDAVCRGMQDKVTAKLIPVMAGGFHGDTYDGMELGLKVLFSYIKNTSGVHDTVTESGKNDYGTIEKETEKMKQSVNLLVPQSNLNPTWWADAEWVKNVFSEIGIQVNVMLPRETALEDLQKVQFADASILLTHDIGSSFAKNIATLGPELILDNIPLPVGITNTARWLRAAGQHFNVSEKVESIITTGEKKVQDILRKRGLMIIPRYRNCRIAISADCTIGIPLVRLLFEELEMIPELLMFRSESAHARQLLENELDDMKIHPKVVFAADGWKIKTALQEVEVDAVLGSSWEKYIAEELGIKLAFDVLLPTNRDLYIDRPYFGYAR